MAGKPLHLSIFAVLMAFFSLFFAPASRAEGVKDSHAAVLLSSSEQAYMEPVEEFRHAIGMEVKIYNLFGDIRHDSGLKNKLLDAKPSLILAIGAKAAYAAKLWTKERSDIPVIFSMVSNWKQYKLLEGQKNIAGIASEISPASQFLNLTIFTPDVRKIGVIYSPNHSKELVDEARQAAAMFGLELIERQIESVKDYQYTYKQIADGIDALWIINDPMVYTLENMDWLKQKCLDNKLVCFGQSRNIAEFGMLIAASPDFANVGEQAASVAHNILAREQHPTEIGVMAPMSTRITLNKRIASKIGKNITQQALMMATDVVE